VIFCVGLVVAMATLHPLHHQQVILVEQSPHPSHLQEDNIAFLDTVLVSTCSRSDFF
jgi:hypothetical protein